MKHFRISIDVDIQARNRAQAESRAGCLYADLEQRPWIVEVLPNGIEERILIAFSPKSQYAQRAGSCRPFPKPRPGGEIVTAAESQKLGVPDLPPDPDGMNDDRAGWAGSALAAFRAETGTDEEDALGDLLANLLHWCDRHDHDFNAALERGRYHYAAETAGEDGA